MAERRMLHLTASSGHHAASSGELPPGAQRGGDTGSARGSARLMLRLFQPDERSFPEFSYTQLLDCQMNQTEAENPLSTSGRENDDIAAISKQLEEKYGSKPKKSDRIQDLIDIGFGYDDDDSFIDNSEAYDEFVPASITTRFGGFYVNSGVLHFRHTSETEAEPEASGKSPVAGGRDKAKKKKRCRESREMMSGVPPKSSTVGETEPDDEPTMKRKKKKKATPTLSVTSMLRKFQREKEKERQKSAALLADVTAPLCPADAGGGGGSGLTDPLLTLIGSTNDHALIQAANAVDLDIDLDSLLDVTEGTFSPKDFLQPAGETPLLRPRTDDQTLDGSQVQPPKTEAKPSVQLPEGLPARLEDSIGKLMAVAKTTEGESKLKFFTPEINSMLLDIEVQSREQGVQLRSKVYTHLSSFLPCSRDALLKRVKRLFAARLEEPAGVQDPLQELKEAISRAMPEQIARFNEKVHEQMRTKASEDERDGRQVDVCPEEDKVVRRGGPKKVFRWSDDIRETFCQVMRAKVDSYQKENEGGQGMERHLKAMLESEIQPLWPKGWMQSRVLMRESRKLLSLFMSSPVKKKKPPLKPRPQETSDVIAISSDVTDCVSLCPERDRGSSTPAQLDTRSAPSRPPLDGLADRAPPQAPPLTASQKLLAAAVAKYKRSAQPWSFELDAGSPPLPPPPPQSSPVGVQLCRDVLPRQLQVGDVSKHVAADEVQIISDDDDITVR